ncbi:hypothetical protein H0W91_00205 [Patescibacteria group bacterium]|nr:hypothetical protein [Patescibacteria group bacterium]
MSENLENNKEIPIREIGSYFEKDKEGFLANPASPEKIQDEWKPIVEDIVNAYKVQYKDKLHSVYVRGSVGKGNAVQGISDVDTFAYVSLQKREIDKDWISSCDKELQVKYPFVQDIELEVNPIEDADKNRLYILQSACLYGDDLNKSMSKIKVGKETLGHVYSLGKNLKYIDEWILKPHESESIKNTCAWIMKRFIRTGIELTMERAGLYTRDLYPSYKIFSEYYPEKEPEMKEALYLVLNPTDDLEIIKKVCNNLGMWLEEQTKIYI